MLFTDARRAVGTERRLPRLNVELRLLRLSLKIQLLMDSKIGRASDDTPGGVMYTLIILFLLEEEYEYL